MKKEYINVLICVDDNFAQHAVVMLTSMFENTRYKDSIRVYLISFGVSEKTLEWIGGTVRHYGGIFKNIVVHKGKEETFFVAEGRGLSETTYLRLYVANLLPVCVDKVIYSDVDVVILGDIKNLWDISLEGYPLGAVVDQGMLGRRGKMEENNDRLGLPKENLYFYSGLQVIDMKQWRENNYSNQLIALARENNFPFHDMDAINKLFCGKIKELPSKWVGGDFLMAVHITSLFIKEFRKRYVSLSKLAILHYCAAHKPWDFDEIKNFNEPYYKYLRMSCVKENTCPRKNPKVLKRYMRRVYFTKLLDYIFR